MECLAGGARRGAGFVPGRLARPGAIRAGSIFLAPTCEAPIYGEPIAPVPNLAGAHLEGANLFKAVLDGADLAGAFLHGAQFLNCAQLVVTRNWQSAFRDDELACGAAIPADPGASLLG